MWQSSAIVAIIKKSFVEVTNNQFVIKKKYFLKKRSVNYKKKYFL